MHFRSTAACLLLFLCCLQACCPLCEARAAGSAGSSPPPPEEGAVPLKLCNSLCSVPCTVSKLNASVCTVYARQLTDASMDFGPTFSACLQMECVNELKVSLALCVQLYVLSFMQSSAQAELGSVLWGMQQVASCSARPPTSFAHVRFLYFFVLVLSLQVANSIWMRISSTVPCLTECT